MQVVDRRARSPLPEPAQLPSQVLSTVPFLTVCSRYGSPNATAPRVKSAPTRQCVPSSAGNMSRSNTLPG